MRCGLRTIDPWYRPTEAAERIGRARNRELATVDWCGTPEAMRGAPLAGEIGLPALRTLPVRLAETEAPDLARPPAHISTLRSAEGRTRRSLALDAVSPEECRRSSWRDNS